MTAKKCDAGQDAEPCADGACREQGCPEHPTCNQGEHTYEQHHSPADHVGDGPCRCNVYAPETPHHQGESWT